MLSGLETLEWTPVYQYGKLICTAFTCIDLYVVYAKKLRLEKFSFSQTKIYCYFRKQIIIMDAHATLTNELRERCKVII